MNKCEHNCKPSCNFCIHSKHGKLETDGTNKPIGCTKHLDEVHQQLACANMSCDDFDCYEADRVEND